MNASSPCLSDYKERFAKFASKRLGQLKRRLSFHKRLYSQDKDLQHVEIIRECERMIKLLQGNKD